MNRTNAQHFSQLTDYDSQYTSHAGRYNVGQFSNFILMPILIEGLKQIQKWKVENIQNYCKELIQPLLRYLESIDIEMEDEQYFSNHLFSLPLPNNIDMKVFQKGLKDQNIILSVRDGKLRISVNVFNDSNDIHQLIAIIQSNSK